MPPTDDQQQDRYSLWEREDEKVLQIPEFGEEKREMLAAIRQRWKIGWSEKRKKEDWKKKRKWNFENFFFSGEKSGKERKTRMYVRKHWKLQGGKENKW